VPDRGAARGALTRTTSQPLDRDSLREDYRVRGGGWSGSGMNCWARRATVARYTGDDDGMSSVACMAGRTGTPHERLPGLWHTGAVMAPCAGAFCTLDTVLIIGETFTGRGMPDDVISGHTPACAE
jgi:hypothetical protein